jgi:hypothetical protein
LEREKLMIIKHICRILAGAAILTGALGGLAQAQATQSVGGVWRGSADIATPGNLVRMVPLTLTITQAVIGQKSGSMRFGAPKSCAVTLQFSGLDAEQDSWFRVAASDGGYCLRLQNRDAVVQVRAAGESDAVSITVIESGISWSGLLRATASQASK